MSTRITALTDEQRAAIPAHVAAWVARGVDTSPADHAVVEAGIRDCYRYAGLTQPARIVWVPSPLVVALAGPIAASLLTDRRPTRGVVDDVDDVADVAVVDAVHGAVRDVVRGAVRGAVHDVDDVDDVVDDVVHGAVRGAVRGAVHDAVHDVVDVAVGDAVHGAVHHVAVGDAVHDAVHDAVRVAVRVAVRGVVHDVDDDDDVVDDAVVEAVHDAVRDVVDVAVGGAVHDAVRAAVHRAVHDAHRVAVHRAVGDAVRDVVDVAVGDAVHDVVDVAVGGAVHDAVRDAVHRAVRDAVGGVVYWWRYLGGQHWAAWGASLAYYRDVCGLQLPGDLWERARAYDAAQSAGWWWAHRDYVIVAERPRVLHTERVAPDGWGSHRLHCATGPAIAWDGWALHYWHGRRVPASLIEGDGWTVEQILAEPNAEIRRCAIERIGWERLVADAGLRAVATAPDPGNAPHELALYDLPPDLADMYTWPARLLLAVNGSVERDGTRRRYGLIVPAHHEDPVAAAADLYEWPIEAYRRLECRR